MKFQINLPDELVARLLSLSPPLDVASVCRSALEEAIDRRTKTITIGTKPDQRTDSMEQVMTAPTRGPGRPPGKTREKRSINLEPRIWKWLESQALPGESFSDTCNRVLLGLVNLGIKS